MKSSTRASLNSWDGTFTHIRELSYCGYHGANQVLIDLTEKLTAGCSEAKLQHLEEIFTLCSRYEMAFWDMAWEQRP